MNVPESVRLAVVAAHEGGDQEGAIETLLTYLSPNRTRDDAVDCYDEIVRALEGEPMFLGRDIEHGGHVTSETRTIGQMRRDANLYAGIGVRKPFLSGKKKDAPGTQKVVDTAAADEVKLDQPQGEATETQASRSTNTMNLSFKSLSKNGKNAFYSGAAVAIRIPLSAFPDKQAPASIEVADGAFAPAKEPKVKMTAEERKTARANKPKPTLAELAKRAQDRADKLAAKLAAGEGDAPQL